MAGRIPRLGLQHWLRIGAVLLLSASAMLVLATEALAYGPVQGNSTFSCTPSSAAPGSTVTCVATFRDQFNMPVTPAILVRFSQVSGPAGCTVTFSSATATTDANGQVSVNVTLPANCPGQFVLAASGGGVTVTTTVTATGGFPQTAAAVPQVDGSGSWGTLFIALGVLLVAAGYLGYRFRTRTPADQPLEVEEPSWPTKEPLNR
jgi:hypothetical protein